MLLALIIVPIVTIYEIGDWVPMTMHMNQLIPSPLDVFKDMSLFKMETGYFGMPDILVPFMAITSAQKKHSVQRIGIFWMIVSTIAAILSGFVGIAYFAHQPLVSKCFSRKSCAKRNFCVN